MALKDGILIPLSIINAGEPMAIKIKDCWMSDDPHFGIEDGAVYGIIDLFREDEWVIRFTDRGDGIGQLELCAGDEENFMGVTDEGTHLENMIMFRLDPQEIVKWRTRLSTLKSNYR